MKGALLLLLVTVAIASISLWYLQDPGYIEISWLGYDVEFTVVVGFLILLFLFLFIVFTARLLRWLFGIPSRWFSFFQRLQDKKANDELLDLLSAYEAETLNEALQHQKKAAPRLVNNPFFLWVSGNLFEKAEKPFEAEQCFMDLTKNPGAAFLGFKGQIRAAMHRGDLKSAHNLLKHARELTPSSPWVLKHFLALAREQKNFKEAESLVLQLEDLGYLSSDQSKKQMAYLQYQQALQPETTPAEKEVLLRQSHFLDPSLAEATEVFALLLQEQGLITYALTALEETWEMTPKQILGDLYLKIASPSDDIAAYQIAKNFVKNNSKNPESRLFLARIAYQAKLWGEARAHLMPLLKQNPNHEVYHLLARLELEAKHDPEAIEWLEKGLEAPRHT